VRRCADIRQRCADIGRRFTAIKGQSLRLAPSCGRIAPRAHLAVHHVWPCSPNGKSLSK
jgi:hypothetical protein